MYVKQTLKYNCSTNRFIIKYSHIRHSEMRNNKTHIFICILAIIVQFWCNYSFASVNNKISLANNSGLQNEKYKSVIDLKFRELESKLDITDKKFELLKDITNISQKNVDWWISFLSIFVAIIGIAIPFCLTWKLRTEYQIAVDDAKKAANESKQYLNEIAINHRQSLSDTDEIKRRRLELNSIPIEQDILSDQSAIEHKQDVAPPIIAEVLNDPNSSDRDRLRASALSYENENKWEDAIELWKALSILENSNPEPRIRCARALEKLSRSKQKHERITFLCTAVEIVEDALRINPAYPVALRDLGIYFSSLATAEDDVDKKINLSNKAVSQLKLAHKFKPNDTFVLSILGYTLTYLSRFSATNIEKIRLLNEAITTCSQAIEIDPKYSYAFINWGEALSELAETVELHDERISILKESIEKLRQSVRLVPGTVYSNVRLADKLFKLSKEIVSTYEKKNLIDESISILREINRLHPEDSYHQIYLSNHIGELSNLTNSLDDKREYLDDAIKRLEAVINFDPENKFAASSLSRWKHLLESIPETA